MKRWMVGWWVGLVGLMPLLAWGVELQLSRELQPGSAVILTVTGLVPGSKLQGSLRGEEFPLSASGQALVALDMEATPGVAELRVNVTPPKGKAQVLRHKLTIPARKYQEERLTLPPKKVDLDPKDLKRSEGETAAIRGTYKLRSSTPFYLEGFGLPVAGGRFSGVFGSRRILNGQPRKPHNGVDIAAPRGSAVVTTAPGKVVLTGDNYFFTGNTVVVDHGHGVLSLYSHLDRIMARQGEILLAGGQVGTLGMTGRATGPHLHWGVLVRGARVDPRLLPGMPE